MLNYLRNILIGVLIGLVLILIFDPHTRYNHDNHSQYAWYVYAPGYDEIGHPELAFSMEGWSVEGHSGLEAEKKVAESFLNTEFFSDYTEIRLIDGHWALYRPESSETVFTFQKLYKITPWFGDK